MFDVATLARKLDRAGARVQTRITVAVVLVCMHLLAFSCAGRERLDLPFNSMPDHAPYFSDPDAPAIHSVYRQPHYWSRLVVSRLDAQHYIDTAVRGLTACPTDPASATPAQYLDCGLGWLPAWGAAGGMLARATGLGEDVALVLMSLIAAILLNLLWTSETIVQRVGRFEAYAAMFAFNLYPTGFQVVTPYTEAATIALLLGALVLLARDRWLLAAICVGASTALRPHAVAYSFAFGCAALVVAWRKRANGEASWWRPIAVAPLAVWGLVATIVALQITLGNGWAFFDARTAFGDAHAVSRLVDPEFYIESLDSQCMDGVIWFVLLAIVLLVGRDVARSFKASESVFLVLGGVGTAVLALLAPMHWWGMDRYMMMSLLVFFAIARLARRFPVLCAMWIVLSMAFYWHVELCAYVAHGNPVACPCHGRLELVLPVTPTM